MQDNRYHSDRVKNTDNSTGSIYLYIAAAVVIIMSVLAAFNKCSGTADSAKAETDAPTTKIETPQFTYSELKILTDRYEFVKRKASDVYEGSLILVNSKNEYKFQNEHIVNIYENKTKSYKVKDTLISMDQTALEYFNVMMDDFNALKGKNDVMIVSGYRTYEFQNQILSERIKQQGEETAKMYVAMPGYSEHHTGLAMDLNVLTASGVTLTLEDDDVYDWIFENCYKYGYVLRYSQDKVSITGISNEPWHFRYVGEAHAYYMYVNDLCLEEYIEFIKDYTYDGVTLNVELPDGKKYELYYVVADADKYGMCSIPVPRYEEYTISGDNSSGFIVTVKK